MTETLEPPAKALAVEAIKLPFRYPREFIKFSWIPVALTAPFQIALTFVYRAAPGRNLAPSGRDAAIGLLLMLTESVIAVPLVVAWIRLAVNGAGAVSHRRMFSVARVEWHFLLAGVAITIAPLVLIFFMILLPFGLLSALGVRFLLTGWPEILLGSAIGVAALIAFFATYARLLLIPIAVALQRYRSLWISWKQTRGMVVRVWAVTLLVSLPFYFGEFVVGGVQSLVYNSTWVVPLSIINQVIDCLGKAALFGGLSLLYKSSQAGFKAQPEFSLLSDIESASSSASPGAAQTVSTLT